MNPALGWAMAAAVLVAGYAGWGWQGVVLAATAVVFWLMLQFNRTLRAMRAASARPVGQVDSAVMLHARLRRGLLLQDVVRLARSLGRQEQGSDETYVWADASGASVRVEFARGRCSSWELRRTQPPEDAAN